MFVPPVPLHVGNAKGPVARARLTDASGPSYQMVDVIVDSGQLVMLTTASSYVLTNSPIIWAAGDVVLMGALAYRAAS